MRTDSIEIAILFAALYVAVRLPVWRDKFKWNNGICRKTGEPWIYNACIDSFVFRHYYTASGQLLQIPKESNVDGRN